MEGTAPVEQRLFDALSEAGYAARQAKNDESVPSTTDSTSTESQHTEGVTIGGHYAHREASFQANFCEDGSAKQDVSTLDRPTLHSVRGLYGHQEQETLIYGTDLAVQILVHTLNKQDLMLAQRTPDTPPKAFVASLRVLQRQNILPPPEVMSKIIDGCSKTEIEQFVSVSNSILVSLDLNLILKVLREAALHQGIAEPCQLGVVTLDDGGQHLFQLFPEDQQDLARSTVLLHRQLFTMPTDPIMMEVWCGFVQNPRSVATRASMPKEEAKYRQTMLEMLEGFKRVKADQKESGSKYGEVDLGIDHPAGGQHTIVKADKLASHPSKPELPLNSQAYANTIKNKNSINETDFSHLTIDALLSGAIHSDLLRGGNIRRVAIAFSNKVLDTNINWLRQNTDEPRQEALKSNTTTKRLSEAHKAEAKRLGKSEAEVKREFDSIRLPGNQLVAAAARRQQLGRPRPRRVAKVEEIHD